jgi:hypothetical protein
VVLVNIFPADRSAISALREGRRRFVRQVAALFPVRTVLT